MLHFARRSALIVAFVTLAAVSITRGQLAAPAATAPVATAPVVDAKAAEVLHKVVDFYKSLKSATATIDSAQSFEMAGKKEQRSTSMSLAVERPNKLSLSVKDEARGGGTAVSDGKILRLHIAALKRHSEEAAPATIEEIITSPVAALAQHGGIVLMLFNNDAYAKMLEGVVKASYAGQDEIDGVKCDHIRVEQEELDFDFWYVAPIGDAHPALRRVKPDLTRQLKLAAQQQPEMKDAKLEASIDVKGWTFDKPISAEALAFAAPADSQKVDSMEEVFNADQPAFKLKGKPAPELSLDLLGGGKTSLAAHKGKDVVILDFWATWCAPCVEAMPAISEVAKEYAAKNVAFYAVNMQEDAPTIEAFLKEHKLDIKVAMDKEGAAATAFAVNGIPQTVIVGKDGTVKVVHVGLSPNLKERLKRDLDQVLASDKPATP